MPDHDEPQPNERSPPARCEDAVNALWRESERERRRLYALLELGGKDAIDKLERYLETGRTAD